MPKNLPFPFDPISESEDRVVGVLRSNGRNARFVHSEIKAFSSSLSTESRDPSIQFCSAGQSEMYDMVDDE